MITFKGLVMVMVSMTVIGAILPSDSFLNERIGIKRTGKLLFQFNGTAW